MPGGAGWLTTEELVWDGKGRLPHPRALPPTRSRPVPTGPPVFSNVRALGRGRTGKETIYRSRAVGEPPLMLGISVLMALSDACAALRPRLPPTFRPRRRPRRCWPPFDRARGA